MTPVDPLGDGVYVTVDELAQVLAAALLDVDEDRPPRVVTYNPTTQHTVTVTGLRYDPRDHLIIIAVDSPRRRRPARWLREDDDPSTAWSWDRGPRPRHGPRLVYGGPVPEPDAGAGPSSRVDDR